MTTITKMKRLKKVLGVLALGALLATNLGATVSTFAAEGDVTVTIVKYVGGEAATAESADNADFQMSATWDATNIGAGTGQYALSETGFNSPNAYTAVTAEMTSGADYTTSEIMDSTVGTVCGTEEAPTTPFALAGYSYGDTLEAAEAMTPSLTPPAFTDMTTSKYVIVWNTDCSEPVVPPAPETVKVQINKYIDGVQATATNASSTEFTMNAVWSSTSHGSGAGQYLLSAMNTPNPYQQSTVNFNAGASYSTNEDTTGNNVGTTCAAGKPFALNGYTSGNSFAEAASGTPSLVAPSFTGFASDKFVIVWNEDCTATSTGGTIGGDVVEASSTLAVTSIETVDGSATANGTFEDGWEYIFHVTVPSDEPNVAMKFSNWTMTSGSSTIPVANNMRISSAQASSTATVLLTAENTYSSPDLVMTGDLDPLTPGKQVEIKVEVAIPAGTTNGSYTTNYGVRSL